jgi:uncharacterized protein YndB with AHSA1/START domain
MRIESERSYTLRGSRDEVWEAIGAVDRYRTWWPWLRRFDGTGLEPGATWHCHVQPPLPYSVRFAVVLNEVEAPRLVTAHLSGDVVGTARVELVDGDHPEPDVCEARLVSSLEPGNGVLRVLSMVARPLVRRGHDWVLEAGARQFIARVLS